MPEKNRPHARKAVDVLTIEQVAAELQISRSRAYALAAEGRLPVLRLGARLLRVPARALREWVKAETTMP